MPTPHAAIDVVCCCTCRGECDRPIHRCKGAGLAVGESRLPAEPALEQSWTLGTRFITSSETELSRISNLPPTDCVCGVDELPLLSIEQGIFPSSAITTCTTGWRSRQLCRHSRQTSHAKILRPCFRWNRPSVVSFCTPASVLLYNRPGTR